MPCFTGLVTRYRSLIESKLSRTGSAEREAKDGLRLIVKGYQRIAQLELPPGAASSFAKLRRNIMELEKLISDAKVPKARPWLLPVPEEQEAWESAFPNGGVLLRRQMCLAAAGDNIWFPGGLFISDCGVAFDSGKIQGFPLAFRTGLLRWEDIVKIDRTVTSGQCPVTTLALTLAGGLKMDKLLVQLSISEDVEWLEQFWGLATDNSPLGGNFPVPQRQWSIPTEFDSLEIPLKTPMPRLMRGDATPPSRGVFQEAEDGAKTRIRSIGRQDSLLDSLVNLNESEEVSKSEAEPQPMLQTLPTSEFPTVPGPDDACLGAPLKAVRMGSGVSLEKLKKIFFREDFMRRFYWEQNKAEELTTSGWAKSTHGNLFLKVSFIMPLPDDVPRVITRLVSIPTKSRATAVWQMTCTETCIRVTYQTCTHEVPFGENFRIQETVSFEKEGAGIEMKKWANVVWVSSLPWTHGIVKTFTEQKAIDTATKSFGMMQSFLESQ